MLARVVFAIDFTLVKVTIKTLDRRTESEKNDFIRIDDDDSDDGKTKSLQRIESTTDC